MRVLHGHHDLDIAFIDALRVAAGLAHLDAALLGHHRGVDHVHVRQHGPQQAGQRRLGQRPGVERRRRAFIDDLHAGQAVAGQLACKAAQFFGQADPGAHLLCFRGRDGRHVQRIGDGAGQQVIADLLGHLQRHILLRFGGGGAQVRRRDHFLVAEQDIFLGGLGLEHVQCRAGDMAIVQCSFQGMFVNQAATGAVDDAHALLGPGDGVGRQDVLGFRRHGHMQGDEIGPRQQVVQLHLLDAQVIGAFLAEEGIIRHHAHLQALGAVGDDAADIAGADQPQHLAGDFHAHEAVLFPLAGLGAGIGRGQFARQRQHQRDGMFGGGDGIAEGRVHHDHAGAGGGGNVHIVHADAGAAHNLQVLRRLQDIGGQLGGAADGDAVILVNDLEQLFLAEARLHIGIHAALLEDGNGGRRQLVGDKNLGHGKLPLISCVGVRACRVHRRVPAATWRRPCPAGACGPRAVRRTAGRGNWSASPVRCR